MIVKPDLQCESPYFHRLWYFYLRSTLSNMTFKGREEHVWAQVQVTFRIWNTFNYPNDIIFIRTIVGTMEL
jgi:hypothetical protein